MILVCLILVLVGVGLYVYLTKTPEQQGAMTISSKRKAELRNYFRIARDVLGDGILKSSNETMSFCKSLRNEVFDADYGPDVDEDMEFVKKLILAIGRHYELEMPRLKVKYSWLDDGKAAHVFTLNGVWYIEVDDRYYGDDLRLMAIIAHEMSHVVLGSKNIALEPTLRNEELTDAVAVLAGFGKIFHEVCFSKEYVESGPDDPSWVRTRTMGYLKREDIEFLLAVKANITAEYSTKRWSSIEPDDSGNMACFACSAAIKVPAHQGTYRVKCSICGDIQRVRFGPIYAGESKLLLSAENMFMQPLLRLGDRLRPINKASVPRSNRSS